MVSVRIKVRPEVKESVVRLQARLKAPTQGEAVRRAVVLMDKVNGYTGAGYTLVLRSKGKASDIEVVF